MIVAPGSVSQLERYGKDPAALDFEVRRINQERAIEAP